MNGICVYNTLFRTPPLPLRHILWNIFGNYRQAEELELFQNIRQHTQNIYTFFYYYNINGHAGLQKITAVHVVKIIVGLEPNSS